MIGVLLRIDIIWFHIIEFAEDLICFFLCIVIWPTIDVYPFADIVRPYKKAKPLYQSVVSCTTFDSMSNVFR